MAGSAITWAPCCSSASASAAACSRARVTTMRRPKSGRASNQRRCPRSPTTAPTMSRAGPIFARARQDVAERAVHCLLLRRRRIVDERRRLLGWPAVREQRADDGADLQGARVADERAAGTGDVRPVHARRFVGLRLVAAQQHDHVARLGIRQRHTRVGGSRDRHGHSRHHFERNPLLVQEDGFLAAAVEDERVTPLQPHDDLALARLVGEQVADGVLIERLGRGGADVDALGLGTGGAHRRGGHAVIVEDDIGMGHAVPAAHRHQRRIARSGADDVDEWRFVHRFDRGP